MAGQQDGRRVAVTGPDGFVAWHVRCAARARWGGDLVHLGHAELVDVDRLAAALESVDAVIHLAGVNRSPDPDEVTRVNPWLAGQLVAGLERAGRSVPVVYGNSVHSTGTSPFGVAKQQAADILTDWGRRTGAPVADVVLPNLFGEHGRPHYNSVVATFCHELAGGRSPQVVDDRALPLLHVQRAAALLLDLTDGTTSGRVDVEGQLLLVSEVLARLEAIATDYVEGVLPDLADPLTRDLFYTYRAATFPEQFPLHPPVHSDARGSLVEAVKARGGQAQAFYSSTRPGFVRGNHFHLHKVERFLVLRGEGRIDLRRLFGHETLQFAVSGERPAIVDMPTMWVHSLVNTGSDELVALFYADELFDPDRPDTYPEQVQP